MTRKKILPLLLALTSFVFAEKQEVPPGFTYWDIHPFHVGGNYIGIAPATVSDVPENGNITYMKGNAFFYVILPISTTSYFLPRVEYNAFRLNWDKNPFFSGKFYSYTQFALTFYSKGLDQWTWIARADYNIDNANFHEPRYYGLFSALLWGTYEVHRKWHTHHGAVGYTGFEGQEVYPIIGLDFSPNKKWTFLLVFPIDYTVQYHLTPEWRLALKARPLKERFRTGPHEPQPRSVFSYSSTGVEFNVHFEKQLRLELEAYVGYNCGGTFYIKNRHGENATYTAIGGAPYGGVSINAGF